MAAASIKQHKVWLYILLPVMLPIQMVKVAEPLLPLHLVKVSEKEINESYGYD